MPTYRIKFNDYVPMYIEQLRPSGSYGKMVEIRKQRMQHYLDEEGEVCAERLIMGSQCHFIWSTNHLVYFTIAILQRELARAGFNVVHYETQGMDVEDMIWWFEHTGKHESNFLKDFRHELQFLFNAGDWGKNLRMYARKATSTPERLL